MERNPAKSPDRWRAKDVVRLIGGLLAVTPVIVLIPAVGAHTGREHDPGSDVARTFSIAVLLESPVALRALITIGVGLLLLVIAKVFLEDELE